ncbi:MAG: hypothetical protein V1775_18130 [Bacteroidota bacterium]
MPRQPLPGSTRTITLDHHKYSRWSSGAETIRVNRFHITKDYYHRWLGSLPRRNTEDAAELGPS